MSLRKVYNIAIDSDLVEEIEEYCKKHEKTYTNLFREAVEQLIRELKE